MSRPPLRVTPLTLMPGGVPVTHLDSARHAVRTTQTRVSPWMSSILRILPVAVIGIGKVGRPHGVFEPGISVFAHGDLVAVPIFGMSRVP